MHPRIERGPLTVFGTATLKVSVRKLTRLEKEKISKGGVDIEESFNPGNPLGQAWGRNDSRFWEETFGAEPSLNTVGTKEPRRKQGLAKTTVRWDSWNKPDEVDECKRG